MGPEEDFEDTEGSRLVESWRTRRLALAAAALGNLGSLWWDSFSSIVRNWAILAVVDDEVSAALASFRSNATASLAAGSSLMLLRFDVPGHVLTSLGHSDS